MASTPRFVRFVRALALVSGGALAACSGAPAVDAGSDSSVSDSAADSASESGADSGIPSDAAVDASVLDTGVASDASDAGADSAPEASADAAREGGSDASADSASDAMAEAGACPMSAPMSGTVCAMSGASCMWTEPGGAFTQCDCDDTGRWMCFTAVPGPLPPPELPV